MTVPGFWSLSLCLCMFFYVFYLFVFYINTPGESLGFVIVNVCLCFFCTGIRHVNIVFIFVYKFSV